MPEAPLLDPEAVAELVRNRRVLDGDRVKARRQALGLRQSDLAQAAGLNISSVCRIEAGTYTPRDDHKLAIAVTLAVEVTDLWAPITLAEVRAAALDVVGAAA